LAIAVYSAVFKKHPVNVTDSWKPVENGTSVQAPRPIQIIDDPDVQRSSEALRQLFADSLAYDPALRIDMSSFAQRLRHLAEEEKGNEKEAPDVSMTPPDCSTLWHNTPDYH